MIFQHFNLIPRKTVMTNVLSGTLSRTGIVKSIFGIYSNEDREKAKSFIKIVGLSGKENQRADCQFRSTLIWIAIRLSTPKADEPRTLIIKPKAIERLKFSSDSAFFETTFAAIPLFIIQFSTAKVII